MAINSPDLFKLAGQCAERLVAAALEAMLEGPGARIVVSVQPALQLTERVKPRRQLPAAKRHAGAQQTKATPVAAPDNVPARFSRIVTRDTAILERLKRGPTQTEALKAVMPQEPGQTLDQREDACRNAIFRLQARKQIRKTPDGWALA